MSYRAEKAFARIAQQERDLDAAEAEEIERHRIASRSMWECIYDLRVDDDLKSVLWALAEGRED